MKLETYFLTIKMLCIIRFSSPMPITNVSGIASEVTGLKSGFVWNGRLLQSWRDYFPEFTEVIDLSNLGIEKLNQSTFVKFVDLYDLNLSSNNLTSTKNVVSALQGVRPSILNISHNHLGSLQQDRPTPYDDGSYKQSKTFLFNSRYFWSVDLSHNSLQGIGIDSDVMHLNLSNNLMQCHDAIESRRFIGEPIYVGNLDLSYNRIHCQNVFFTPNINTLDMSFNQLGGLDADGLLRGLKLLTKLNLRHNNIRYIHPRAFEDTTRLRYLNLNHNRIRTIYKQVWSPLTFLRYIGLSSNRLENLEWEDVTFVQKPAARIVVDVTYNGRVEWSSDSNYFRFCDYAYHSFDERQCSDVDIPYFGK